MEFCILGPLEVVDEGTPLDLGGPKQRALLAMLLIEANRVVSPDRLIEALWEEGPPETPRRPCSCTCHSCGSRLGGTGSRRGPPATPCASAPTSSTSAGSSDCAEGELHEALALWRGPPLAESHTSGSRRRDRPPRGAPARLPGAAGRPRPRARRAPRTLGELEAPGGRAPVSGAAAGAADARLTARAARPTRSRRTGRRAARSWRSSGSSRAVAARAPAGDPRAGSRARPDRRRSARRPRRGARRSSAERPSSSSSSSASTPRSPAPAASGCSPASPGSARAGSPRSCRRGARSAARACSSGAAGRPAARRRTGPGCSRCGHTSGKRRATLRAQLGAGGVELAQILPELRERLPGLARARLGRARGRALPPLRRDRAVPPRRRRPGRCCSSSTTCTRPTRRRCCCSSSSPASSRERMLVVGAFRDVDPLPGRPSRRDAGGGRCASRRRGASRSPVCRRAGESSPDVDRELGRLPVVRAVRGDRGQSALPRARSSGCSLSRRGRDATLRDPETVRDVIGRRLAHLSPECNRCWCSPP